MPDSYHLGRRQAHICRATALLFALVAALQLGTVIFSAAARLGAPSEFRCDHSGCVTTVHVVQLLPADERASVARSPAAMAAFSRYVGQRWVRALSTLIAAIAAIPTVLLLAFIARAMWSFGASREPLTRALSALRAAAWSALAAAVVPPVTDSLSAMLLMPGTPSGPMWYFIADLRALGRNMLLAIAAYAVTWALAAGARAHRDLADFV